MIAFSVWGFSIYWYGIFYLISFLLGYFFLKFVGKLQIFSKFEKLQSVLQHKTDDLLIAIILGVLIWWRLGEVFIYQWEYFSKNLLEIFAVWNWWMSFVGGAIWVFVSLLIFKRLQKLSTVEFFLLFDCILVFVPIAILLWRFWNYLNQELYWILVPANFWWLSEFFVTLFTKLNIFHVYSSVDTSIRVNTNFLAMFFEWFLLFNILITVFINQIKKQKIKPWMVIWYFLVFYSLFRFFIEYFRVDSQSQFLWFLTKSQIIFVFLFIVWFLFLFNRKNLNHKDLD